MDLAKMKPPRPASDVALEKYPRSAALRSIFLKGAAAGAQWSGKSDYDNPYHKLGGFTSAFRNAWWEGWASVIRKEITIA